MTGKGRHKKLDVEVLSIKLAEIGSQKSALLLRNIAASKLGA